MALVLTLSNSYAVITIGLRYLFKYKIINMKYDNYRVDPNSVSFRPRLTMELIVCSVFLPPYINVNFHGEMLNGVYNYNLGEIIMIFMLLRVYLVPRLYGHYSRWTGTRARAVCKNYSTISDAVFAFKSDLKLRPFLSIGTIFTFAVIFMGIAVMQAERHFEPESERAGGVDMGQLTNNQWMIFVTMATIGYGDIYPTTHHGRFFCILACVCGMILVSALIVALNKASELSKEQRSAYLILKSEQGYREWMNSASNVIKFAFKCAATKFTSVKRLKFAFLLKQAVFEHERITKTVSTLSVTSTEMLHELQKQAELKFKVAKSVIVNIPEYKKRCELLRDKQLSIEAMVDKICDQQKIIYEFVNKKCQDGVTK